MPNSVYEFGQIANVIIYPKSDMQIGKKTYKAGMPYTVLEDVNIQLQYEQNTATSNGVRPVISAQNARPYRVAISGLVLNDKVIDLITQRQAAEEAAITRQEECFVDGDTLFLSEEPANADSIWVFNSKHELVEGWQLVDSKLVGTFEETKYLVFYKVYRQCANFNFEMPHYPYFELEVQIKGNSDKHSHDLYMFFPAVSLITVPTFNAFNGEIFSTPMIFDLIYHGQPEPRLVIC